MDMTRIRDRMVEHHVTRRGIRDQSVIGAMRMVPREKFVPPGSEEFAYQDAPLSIGEGQTISQPFIVALMLEKANLNAGDKVLEVGTGSGYASALISRIARHVYSIERHEKLALQATDRFEKLGYRNIDVRVGDGSKGWAEVAPFNAIVVSAGAPEVPTALKEQLHLGGRLIIPVGGGEGQRLKRFTRTGAAAFEEEDLGGVLFVPLIGEDAWTASHPMYTVTAPSLPGTIEPKPSSPRNAQGGGMGRIHKLPALPEGVLDHSEFQQRFWAVQRISWIVFTLLLVTCLLGLLGRGGPFSRQTLLLPEGSVDFPVISRWNAPEDMTVTFTPSSEDRIFTIDGAFLQSFSVQGIDPPQKATFARDGRIGYVFPADPAGPTQIVFRLQTQMPGPRRALIAMGGETRTQSTFIFP
ncbi:protein-L-isoaspartate(D-aspartate) O-methyltransferase [Rhizobium leguminosarum]|uniref:Protein-L-isoaspartate O-methyltransferase n=1 Tax=Rhizobium leguminosarum TaxID=384 RepID=A0AAJ1AC48_RHILE|nr:protein-L-isoaspartate(D-aspartate) O-methyltransferase [Rhizobium leguminosarum]MBY5536184.1 protein-L-isoaspartate(D-aspartate) O-methyltransferase [Rhizobium leguminosarum]MBY5597677.1 protein-L-isoaspartate(D-aspartate) O-methyltransferase [Rhizobium leguminosarum]MBY5631217.1 protein-L-isoaspartate(D-aspartate) O-methyltransferase [Rhizobium leguminosarum]